MASGREQRIKAAKRAEYRDRQRYNYIKSRLDQERSAQQAQNVGQVVTPGTQAPSEMTYTNTPAWAQNILNNSYTGPATTAPATPSAFSPANADRWYQDKKPTTKGPPQWWQYAQQYSANRNPFANVTGTAGTGTNQQRQPAYGGSYNPTVSGGNTPNPYIPAWITGRPPAYGGSYNPATGNPPAWLMGRSPAYGGTYNPTPPPAPTNAPIGVANRVRNAGGGSYDFLTLNTPTTGGGGYYGYSGYKPWRRGGRGGGGWSSRYGGNGYSRGGGYNNSPAWSRGLASWNIG